VMPALLERRLSKRGTSKSYRDNRRAVGLASNIANRCWSHVSEPDGQTCCWEARRRAASAAFILAFSYDPIGDFRAGRLPLQLLVLCSYRNSLPVKSVAKSSPRQSEQRQAHACVPGHGSRHILWRAVQAHAIGTVSHVPYRGAARDDDSSMAGSSLFSGGRRSITTDRQVQVTRVYGCPTFRDRAQRAGRRPHSGVPGFEFCRVMVRVLCRRKDPDGELTK